MTERKPVRDRYDAVFDFARPGKRALFVLIKHRYRILPEGGLAPADPVPLENDVRDPELSPRLPRDSDFWPHRAAADVIVRGDAVQLGGKPFTESVVMATVGALEKRVKVSGPRRVVFESGVPVRVEREGAERVPLTWESAYGGFDDRTRDPLFETPEAELLLSQFDHPGIYPRNPFGRGYMVVPEPPPELWLPQLEDPSDVLGLDRVVVGDPKLWWRQPLPWCFESVHPVMYPRCVLFAPEAEPWHEGPDDGTLPEVQRGYLPPGYRAALEADAEPVHPRFVQEASHGMSFPELPPGTPISVSGMHPEHALLQFTLPAPPRLVVRAEGVERDAPMRLYKLVVQASELYVTALHGALFEPHRTWIPGIHAEIPIDIQVDGDLPLPYSAPQPILERVRSSSTGPLFHK